MKQKIWLATITRIFLALAVLTRLFLSVPAVHVRRGG